ncbi:MAG: archease [Deltaproteobacteria bacterium]|nr:archease [Deltaproteobacteria bacterium]
MDSDKPHFSLLDHTADLGMQVHGPDLVTLFEEAARSIICIMIGAPRVGKTDTMKLHVDAQDLPDLMVRWLGEILYLLQGEKKVVTHVKIDSLSPVHLVATLKTVPFDPNRHEIIREIKAVTYHQIDVAQKNDQWEARVIFDL